MTASVQSKKDMFDVREQAEGIREELPQTRLGLTMGRVLTAGPLGFLVVCGALYQTTRSTGPEKEKQGSSEPAQEVQKAQKLKTVSVAKKGSQAGLAEEVAFNIALEVLQHQMN